MASANAGRLSGSLAEGCIGGGYAGAASLGQSLALGRCDSPNPVSSLQRRDLRAISNRLEQHAVFLRERSGVAERPGVAGVATTATAAAAAVGSAGTRD